MRMLAGVNDETGGRPVTAVHAGIMRAASLGAASWAQCMQAPAHMASAAGASEKGQCVPAPHPWQGARVQYALVPLTSVTSWYTRGGSGRWPQLRRLDVESESAVQATWASGPTHHHAARLRPSSGGKQGFKTKSHSSGARLGRYRWCNGVQSIREPGRQPRTRNNVLLDGVY